MDTLHALIDTLAKDPNNPNNYDWETAAKLALAGVGLELPFPLPHNIQEEAEDQIGKEVWVISDVLAESLDRDFAHAVGDNITQTESTYIYFVQAGGLRTRWTRALDWIQEKMPKGEPDLLSDRISVYEISRCAFTARMKITHPRGRHPAGHYGLGARDGSLLFFQPVPPEIVLNTVDIISELLLIESQKDDSTTKKMVGDPDIGFIRKLFPLHSDLRDKP